MVRDRKTGLNRGFGYVNFKNEDAVALALKLDGTEVNNRSIRVTACKNNPENFKKPQTWKKGQKRSLANEGKDNKPFKKLKDNSQKGVARPVST